MIKRIKVPKFRVGKYVLNEYELKNLCMEIATKKRKDFIGTTVTCLLSNETCTLEKNGTLSNPIKGASLMGNIISEMFF